MFYAGLDLGKRRSYLAVVDERGRTVRQGSNRLRSQALRPRLVAARACPP